MDHRTIARTRTTRSVIAVVVVVAAIATLVVAATRAEGSPGLQALTNDGGAWLVHRENGYVGHSNRLVEEISAEVRVSSPGTNFSVYQPGGLVAVRSDEGDDEGTDKLIIIDPAQRAIVAAGEVALPEGTQVLGFEDGLVFISGEADVDSTSLVVRRVETRALAAEPTLTNIEQLQTAARVGPVSVSYSGIVAFVNLTDAQVQLIHRDDSQTALSPPEDQTSIDVVAIDRIAWLGDRPVVQYRTGEIHVYDAGLDMGPPVVLSAGHRWAEAAMDRNSAAEAVVGITADGIVEQVSLIDGTATVLGELNATGPQEPIVHQGCVYALASPRLLSSCPAIDLMIVQELENVAAGGAGLRLLLVNDWIWINDQTTGSYWRADGGQLDEGDVWDPGAVPTVATSSEPDIGDGAGEEIIDESDAAAETRTADPFDPNRANENPVANPDDLEVRPGRTTLLDVLENDTDPNEDVLVVTDVDNQSPELLDVLVTADGSSVQVRPRQSASATATFRYTITDGRGGSDSALVTVAIKRNDATSNQPPVPKIDRGIVRAGSRLLVNVLDNDTDPDGDSLVLVEIEAEAGRVLWDSSGEVVFLPDNTESSGTIDITYVVEDDFGARTDGLLQAEIRGVAEANEAPDARNDAARTVVGVPTTINVLANDTDPENDPIVVESEATVFFPAGSSASASLTTDGVFTFVPEFSGTHLFRYAISDGSEIDEAQIRVDVDAAETNKPPVAVRDEIVIPRGEDRIVFALSNDGDPDGDVIGITGLSVPPDSGLVVRPHQGIGFSITVEESAPDRAQFTYEISDGINEPVAASVGVAVSSGKLLNQPPVARSDEVRTRPGLRVTAEVLRNDFDPESGPLRVVGVAQGTGYTATIGGDGQSIDFEISEDTLGPLTVAYDVADEEGTRASALIRVRIIPDNQQNREPEARPDRARTLQATVTFIPVLANDIDADGDAVQVEAIIEQPARGTATIDSSTGAIAYTPDADFTGTDRFEYSIVDANGASAASEVIIGVIGDASTNDPPIARDDSFRIAEGANAATINVLENDSDPNGDQLVIVALSPPDQGAAGVTSDRQSVTYRPPSNVADEQEVRFEYQISDGNGGFDRALVTVLVEDNSGPVDGTPEAEDDFVGPFTPGETITVPVIDNDTDPDGRAEDLRVSVKTEGVFVDGDGQTLRLVVPVNTTSFSYTITDLDGLSDSATVTVKVVGEPEVAPTPVPEDPSPEDEEEPPEEEEEPQEEEPTEQDLAPNAEDVITGPHLPGEQVTVTVVEEDTDPDDPAEDLIVTVEAAGLEVDGAGVTLVVPAQSTDYRYTITDPGGLADSAKIVVVVDTPPRAINDQAGPFVPGEAVAVDVTANDIDEFGSQLRVIQVDGGAIADGRFIRLDAAPNETTRYEYIVEDNAGQTDGAVLTVVVSSNVAPLIEDASVTTAFETQISIDIHDFVTDRNEEDELRFTCCERVRGGRATVQISGANELTILFEPDSGREQPAHVGFAVDDLNGHRVEGTVKIEIEPPPNRPPTARPAVLQVEAGGAAELGLGSFVDDPDEGDVLTFSVVEEPGSGLGASFEDSVLTVVAGDEVAPGVYALTFAATDSEGESAEEQVEITVLPQSNVAPTAQDGQVEITAGSTDLIDLSRFAEDGDQDPLTFELVGTISSVETTIRGSQLEVTAPIDSTGDQEAISWVVRDPQGEEAPAVLTLVVVAPNLAPPTATADSARVLEGQTESIPVLANDSDPIGQGLDIVRVFDSAQGDAAINGATIEFTPNDGFSGIATFQYTIADQSGLEDRQATGLVEVTVIGLPGKPQPPAVERGPKQVLVTWTTPPDNGAPIETYEIKTDEEITQDVGLVNNFTWEGLVNGTEYQFSIRARNEAGWSEWSDFSLVAIPNQVASPPAAPVVDFGDRLLNVAWTEPANEGTDVTGYELRISDGTTRFTEGFTLEWQGLTNCTDYRFEVRAENEAGWSEWSLTSDPEHPSELPEAPKILETGRGDQFLTVNWQNNSLGCDQDGPSHEVQIGPTTAPAGILPLEFVGAEAQWADLDNGIEQQFRVRTLNRAGKGRWSAWSAPLQPCGVPFAPPQPVAVRDDLSAVVTFEAADGNGCDVLDYRVIVVETGATLTLNVPGSITVTDLVNGTPYTFVAEARNVVGAGTNSLPSNPIVPAGIPLCGDSTYMLVVAVIDSQNNPQNALSYTGGIFHELGFPEPNGVPLDSLQGQARWRYDEGLWTDWNDAQPLPDSAGFDLSGTIDLFAGNRIQFEYRYVSDVGPSDPCDGPEHYSLHLFANALEFVDNIGNLGPGTPNFLDLPFPFWDITVRVAALDEIGEDGDGVFGGDPDFRGALFMGGTPFGGATLFDLPERTGRRLRYPSGWEGSERGSLSEGLFDIWIVLEENDGINQDSVDPGWNGVQIDMRSSEIFLFRSGEQQFAGNVNPGGFTTVQYGGPGPSGGDHVVSLTLEIEVTGVR